MSPVPALQGRTEAHARVRCGTARPGHNTALPPAGPRDGAQSGRGCCTSRTDTVPFRLFVVIISYFAASMSSLLPPPPPPILSLRPKDSEGGRSAPALGGDPALCPRQTPALSPHPTRIPSVLLFFVFIFLCQGKIKDRFRNGAAVEVKASQCCLVPVTASMALMFYGIRDRAVRTHAARGALS